MTLRFTKAQQRSFETAAQRAGALRGKGFLAFEVDGVVARFAGKGKRFPTADIQRRLGPLLTMGAMWLGHAKRRIRRGQLATRPQAFQNVPRDKKRGYVVSQLYAQRARGGADVAAGSSAEWHAQAGNRAGFATGALISSLQARTSGRNAVRFDAQGSSIGTSTYFRTLAAGAKGNRRGKTAKRKVGRFVRNQWKLNAVWRHLRANLIQPEDDEAQAIASALGVAMSREFWHAMGGSAADREAGRGPEIILKQAERQLSEGAAASLYADLRRRWVK